MYDFQKDRYLQTRNLTNKEVLEGFEYFSDLISYGCPETKDYLIFEGLKEEILRRMEKGSASH